MTQFVLKISVENDAFSINPDEEIERILLQAIKKVRDGYHHDGKAVSLLDINGNKVGQFKGGLI